MTTLRKLKTSKPCDLFEYGKLFLQHQAGRGLADKTLKMHRNIINILLAEAPTVFADKSEWKRTITKLLTGKNEGYYNKILATSQQFFDYLIDEGVMEDNPTSKFKYRKEGSRIIRHSEETIRKL